jgi:hypothetical protein
MNVFEKWFVVWVFVKQQDCLLCFDQSGDGSLGVELLFRAQK